MIREIFWRAVWALTHSEHASQEISEARLQRRIAKMIREAKSIEIRG